MRREHLSPDLVKSHVCYLLQEGSTLRALGESPIAQELLEPGAAVIDVARALRSALDDAVAALGDGPYGHAAQALLGMSPGERGLPLKVRRAAAADCIDKAVDTFRREYEPTLIDDVAWELAGVLSAGPTAAA